MTLRVGTIQCCCALWLALLALASLVAGQSDPKHEISSFENLPARIFFFDDTDSAIYHDSHQGNVYVSQDEGKSWAQADDIPSGRAVMVFEHPFNNRIAFVLTDDKKHYRTEDRGKTWRSFEVPIAPALVQRPLSFHSDPQKYGYILYQGTVCDRVGWGGVCHDETYYTKDGFSSEPTKLLTDTSRCQFAHSSADFKHDSHPDLVYCVAFDTPSSTGSHSYSSSRLYSSTDFFEKEKTVEDFGIGKNAKGVIALAIVSKYAVVAMKDVTEASNGEMLLYVTVDTNSWARAQFPHASSAKLRENAYTIVESTTHSLGVDVLLQDRSAIGTLFLSNSNGTFFVESLKDTNRNDNGFVDYERLYGLDGVGLANIVANAKDVETRRARKLLKTRITYNDGRSWSSLRPPPEDSEGKRIHCDSADTETCSLHLHSVTTPHNFGRIFSSPAPGFVMGVGSVGDHLKPYKDSDTFLSTDGGQTWKMVRRDAHKYEFGDQGSVLVVVNDEDTTNVIRYSLDLGKTWKEYNFGLKIHAGALVTLPDSTSQKFLLLGLVPRKERKHDIGAVVIVYLDFQPTRKRKCEDGDFEHWYARGGDSQCIMGHKQWYRRRKPDADCYVGEKYIDPVEHDENCECTDEDYECDYNFVLQDNKCVAAGPEPIPAGVCKESTGTYQGSSGYRKIPGNTCVDGVRKDAPVEKDCSKAQPAEGQIVHQSFEFKSQIVQHAYFKGSTTILVRLHDATMWQSSSEGYMWNQLFPDKRILAFYHHKFASDRAYLITDTDEYFYTTNFGQAWHPARAPSPPNTFGAQVLRFHPTDSDRLIWVGNRDCSSDGSDCRAEAKFSRDHGRRWDNIDHYVKNCAWAKDSHLDADPTEIICESWKDKKGSQRHFGPENTLELIAGADYYERRKKIFDNVVGFAKFSEFLVVAEVLPEQRALELQVSLDGNHFAGGKFPPSMHPNAHAYTILESNTGSLFLHMTMSEPPFGPYWGNILKSNSNGTYFGLSIENVNRNEDGFVDFEKVIGLDGVALINVVADPGEATVSKRKTLQSRITHNDGGSWKPLNPPPHDSLGNKYECEGTKCALHIHGYTERRDPRATYSSTGIVGILIAVGNVGETLKPYKECDTFLSRDAGFTWEEVHKDAHMWEFGDSGSVLVIVNDEGPTDHVLFSTDEGLSWREYRFSDEKILVDSIVTVSEDNSRRFILFGSRLRVPGSTAVHIDFSMLTTKHCVLDLENPNGDDFELWGPSIEREERCLFGRQTLYHRRKRQANCVVGKLPKTEESTVATCPCASVDFECEFNHIRNADDQCVPVPGTQPLPNDNSCQNGEEFWYERTEYRLIPYSSCEGGLRPDRGKQHVCPGFKSKGPLFWMFMLLLPFGFTALVGYYYYRRSGLARGTIRLPGDGFARSDNRFHRGMDTLASVPWFLVGIAGIAFEWISSRIDRVGLRSRRGYRDLPVDEDAQVLRFEDEE
ncbi:vacuolar protein sorting/targeting protein 10 [Macrolepiota fuliginosa MF-IS2]|uniref:Vacuolar protein sorting/targeting protein 10 n=1 Tax=Macrolepiota fuliginosa MF-IS2 TaxID=1400762 RepID=A0A9P5XGT6_9AGAR|nr:vacuolar protein sorting/targeting protein 10 [Macrolepiota fuliginosa MF-IS2]